MRKVSFKVLLAARMKTIAFWDIVPCSTDVSEVHPPSGRRRPEDYFNKTTVVEKHFSVFTGNLLVTQLLSEL